MALSDLDLRSSLLFDLCRLSDFDLRSLSSFFSFSSFSRERRDEDEDAFLCAAGWLRTNLALASARCCRLSAIETRQPEEDGTEKHTSMCSDEFDGGSNSDFALSGVKAGQRSNQLHKAVTVPSWGGRFFFFFSVLTF